MWGFGDEVGVFYFNFISFTRKPIWPTFSETAITLVRAGDAFGELAEVSKTASCVEGLKFEDLNEEKNADSLGEKGNQRFRKEGTPILGNPPCLDSLTPVHMSSKKFLSPDARFPRWISSKGIPEGRAGLGELMASPHNHPSRSGDHQKSRVGILHVQYHTTEQVGFRTNPGTFAVRDFTYDSPADHRYPRVATHVITDSTRENDGVLLGRTSVRETSD